MRFSILLLIVGLSTSAFAQTFRWNQETLRPEVIYDNQPAPAAQPASYNDVSAKQVEVGMALYYADYLEGRATALGEVYQGNQMTAAHQSLPLGTIVKVTRLDNGLSTVVRINDRGPFCEGCVIDLSTTAAQEIDLMQVGRSRVSVQIVGQSDRNPPAPAFVANNQNLTARGVPAQPQSYNAVPTSRINTEARSSGNNTLTARSPTANTNQVNILANAPNGYAIQLGSYGDFGNAERHVVRLQERGFNQIFIYQEVTDNGQTLNRVIVAPFRTNTEAQTYLNELQSDYQMRGLVIRIR